MLKLFLALSPAEVSSNNDLIAQLRSEGRRRSESLGDYSPARACPVCPIGNSIPRAGNERLLMRSLGADPGTHRDRNRQERATLNQLLNANDLFKTSQRFFHASARKRITDRSQASDILRRIDIEPFR